MHMDVDGVHQGTMLDGPMIISLSNSCWAFSPLSGSDKLERGNSSHCRGGML